MTVYITAIQPSNATHTSHITKVRWLDSKDHTSNTMTTAQAIDFIAKGNQLIVAGPKHGVAVQVVHAQPPYIRTAPDDTTKDNLLELPRI